MMHASITIFTVKDVMASRAYFRDKLSFEVAFEYGNPTCYVGAARSFHADLLGLKPVSLEPSALLFDVGPLLIVEPADDEARKEGLVGRFAGFSLQVENIETLHARLKARGCIIAGPPERQAWGGG